MAEYTTRVETRDGRYYVTREITGLAGPVTRWDFLTDAERAGLAATPFTANGTGVCSKCGTALATEADFAQHFVVPDVRYLNLGQCPTA